MSLPADLFTADQIRQIEARVIAAGLSGAELMQRAGAAAFGVLRQHWPLARAITVVCGAGNNGGDGRVVARLAAEAGLRVTLCVDSDPAANAQLQDCDVIVDALLGIGVNAPLRASARAMIDAINRSDRPVLSLDIPSGLHPDSGNALPAIRATVTVCFVALKQGLFLDAGPDHCGVLYCDDLGAFKNTIERPEPGLRRTTEDDLTRALPVRPRNSHKGMFGRVLIIGGGVGMPGAVRLAAEAALRVGAGQVTVASLPQHLDIIAARPELMFCSTEDDAAIATRVAQADVIAVGPGLGRSDWSRRMLNAVFATRKAQQKLVLDADALNLLADGVGPARCDDWVLTPHPGEAARLLAVSSAQVQSDRAAALHALCEQRGGVVILKGAATLVGQSGKTPRLCDRGNAGMAVAGMGDVLTGAVAGLLAQQPGQQPQGFDAAVAAVFAHASAGDLCARGGIRGILASEVGQRLRAVLRPWS
jgi:ADP-dependent NAD(P)H-hydrate dehydratase / NAD(P)H-hydrate epimerase